MLGYKITESFVVDGRNCDPDSRLDIFNPSIVDIQLCYVFGHKLITPVRG